MTRHVVRQLNLLIDGRLEREDALKAMAHLEECEACTAEWAALRKDREALQTSGSGIDMRFAQRLLDRERIAVIARSEPRRHAKAANSVRPHVLRASFAAASGAFGLLAVLYMLGEPQEIPLGVLIAGNSASGQSVQVVSLGGTSQAAAFDSPVPAWVSPEMVSLGTVTFDDGGVLLSQTTVRMGEHQLVVTEGRGRLPADVGDFLERSIEGERSVFILEGDETAILFASADNVVMVDCACSEEILVGFASQFPEAQSPGVLTRVGDGVEELADAVTGG